MSQSEPASQTQSDVQGACARGQLKLLNDLGFDRALLDNESMLVVVLDGQGRIRLFNRAAQRVSGYTFEEVQGRSPWDELLQESCGELSRSEVLDKMARGGTQLHTTYNNVWVSKTGELRLLEWINTPLYTDGKTNASVVCIGHEITQRDKSERNLVALRKRTQKAMREAVAFRDAVGKQSIVSMTDLSGNIVFCNQKFTDISGYTRSELLGRDHRIINSGHHPKSFWVEMWRIIARGDSWRAEVCNRAKDGSIYWVDTIVAPYVDADGNVEKFVSIRTEITERIAAEDRIRWNESQLNQAQRLAGIGSWVFQVRENKLNWSDTIYDIFEVDKESFEASYEAFIRFIHPDDRAMVDEAYARSLLLNEPYDVTYRLLLSDGYIKYVNGRCQTEYDSEENPIRSLGTIQDITHIRQTEIELERARDKAEAANRAKSEFLANMSHEIRTPMTAILGFADLIDNDDIIQTDPDMVTDAVKTIRTNAHHLLTVINDILDMSRLEAGKMSIEYVTTQPVHVVQEVVSLLCPRAQAKGIALELTFASSIPETIESDPIRLRQILINLISNAIKFTHDGSVSINMSFDAQNRTLRYTITDTGIGMTDSQLQSIMQFDAFNQADTSMARRFGGTGLGLRIANTLAKLLGGSIQACSMPGEGSTFSFSFPTGINIGVGMIEPEQFMRDCSSSDDDPRDPFQESPAQDDAKQLQYKRILLAEDGPDNQRLVTHHLTKAGAQVFIAQNGRIAIEHIDATRTSGAPFDLVLMDMQMPEMDGYEATKLLREQGCTLPILALTAHAMQGDREKCLDAGCDDYLTKPIDRAKLIDACQHWIAQAPSRVAG